MRQLSSTIRRAAMARVVGSVIATVMVGSPLVAQRLPAQDVASADTPHRVQFFMYNGDRKALVPMDSREVPVLRSRIAVDFSTTSVRDAINAIAKQAGIVIWYSDELLAKGTPVTLRASNITVAAALTDVLADVPVDVVFAKDGSVSLLGRRTTRRLMADSVTGRVGGTVTDAATKRPISGVTVTIDGVKQGVQTGNDGAFLMPGVAVGTHRVVFRRLGYEAFRASVEVKEGQTATASAALIAAASRLTDVVTTATGKQRRLEVGTVIAHINADSVVKTAPVMSVTDLLAGRAPSVQIVQHSGLVGAGPAIRIRGQSSLNVAGDPIIIVDGIRVDNRAGGAYNSNFGTQSSPSRINDLDFKQIETDDIATVDILKGPAATTEYGTDAANGVIVITTKRGKPGPTTWGASVTHGWSEIPTSFPDYWWAFGHTSDGTVVHCQLLNVAAGTCQIDSVIHDNPLNHAETTNLGTGPSQAYHLNVGGGSAAVRYALNASSSQQDGTTHLPDVFKPMVQALGLSPSVMDPNTQTQQSASANLNVTLSPTADLAVNTQYMSTRRMSPMGSGLTPTSEAGPIILDSAHFYGYPSGTPLAQFNGSQSEATSRTVLGLSLDWRPSTWLTGHVSGGSDRGSQRTVGVQTQAAAQYWEGGYAAALGYLQITDQVTTVTSGDARAAAMVPLARVAKWTSSIGLNVAKNSSHGLTGTNYNMTRANPTLNGTPGTQTSQIGDGSTTAGVYIDEQVSIADRLFFTSALRMDGASGFGGDARTTAYPKFNASWLAYNGDAATIRLRAAFGVAGVQPANGSSAQQFQAQTATLAGVSVPISLLTSPGNPILRPERSREWEEGIDLGLLNGRLNLEFSSYSKHTTDELISVGLGLTFNNMSVFENLGNVVNSGIEGSLNATLLSTNSTVWSATINASHNSNKLVRLAPGLTVDNLDGATMHVVGYPLYGYWGKRIAFADTNGNNIIERSEVHADTANSFLGSSMPNIEVSYSTSLSLWRGRLVLNTGFDSKSGDVVSNQPNVNPGSLEGQNDIHASLFDQAQAVAIRYASRVNALNFEKGWFLAWRDLSATFNVPTSWLRGLRGREMSVTASVANLAKWTHYTGLDPEVSDVSFFGNAFKPGTNYGDARRTTNESALPIPRTWMLGANIGF